MELMNGNWRSVVEPCSFCEGEGYFDTGDLTDSGSVAPLDRCQPRYVSEECDGEGTMADPLLTSMPEFLARAQR